MSLHSLSDKPEVPEVVENIDVCSRLTNTATLSSNGFDDGFEGCSGVVVLVGDAILGVEVLGIDSVGGIGKDDVN